MKTDLYTKIVLTVIAIALIGILIKDIDFVSKAQAAPVNVDLSALNIEKAKGGNDGEMTFFIYDNDALHDGFSTDSYNNATIDRFRDKPKYIVTNKKGSFSINQ